jgi:hypothetical protein
MTLYRADDPDASLCVQVGLLGRGGEREAEEKEDEDREIRSVVGGCLALLCMCNVIEMLPCMLLE